MADTKGIACRWIAVWGNDDPTTLPLAPGLVHESPLGKIVSVRSYYDTRNLLHVEPC